MPQTCLDPSPPVDMFSPKHWHALWLEKTREACERQKIKESTAAGFGDFVARFLKNGAGKNWIFEGQEPGIPIAARTIDLIFDHACQKAKVPKKGEIHTLRHSSPPIYWNKEPIFVTSRNYSGIAVAKLLRFILM
jgi:hypothetical protein